MNQISRRSALACWVFLLVCLAAIVFYHRTSDELWIAVIYIAMGLASVVAILVGVRVNHPSLPSAWYLMAVGLFLLTAGDAIQVWIASWGDTDAFPTIADAFYLAAYPFLAAGLIQLIRARRPVDDLSGFLDSAIFTAGLVVVLVMIAGRNVASDEESLLAMVVAAAYPIASIVLLGMLIGLITVPGTPRTSLAFLGLAIAALVIADVGFAWQGFHGTAKTGFDVLWLASYALWGAAALHPSMRALSERTVRPSMSRGDSWLIALAVTTFIAFVGLSIKYLLGLPIDAWLVGVTALALMGMAIARMRISLKQIAASNRALIQTQETLAYQATHDALTGVPNRAHAVHLISAALSGAEVSGGRVAVLFLDLDGFKQVNDTVGHGAGDELLRQVAARLRDNVRADDITCRLGGDEFLILLAPLTEEADALAVADRLLPIVSAPITVADQRNVTVGVSIGLAISQDHDTTTDVLLKEADEAVYRAKRLGRGRVSVFDAEMRQESRARTELEGELARAIEKGELALHYQPIIHVGSGALQGFEALVRWPRGGVLVPPSEFIPIAEQSELICELGAWALRQATQQLARWNERSGSSGLTVTVNLSGRHISSPRALADVREAVAASGIDPTQLVLEITETTLIDDARRREAPRAAAPRRHRDRPRRFRHRVQLHRTARGSPDRHPEDRSALHRHASLRARAASRDRRDGAGPGSSRDRRRSRVGGTAVAAAVDRLRVGAGLLAGPPDGPRQHRDTRSAEPPTPGQDRHATGAPHIAPLTWLACPFSPPADILCSRLPPAGESE